MIGPVMLVAEFADEAEVLVASLRSFPAARGVRAIALQPQAASVFRRAGLTVDDTVSWLTSEAHERVSAACMKLSVRWYQPIQTRWPDAFQLAGWSFGEDAEHVVSGVYTSLHDH